jgi:hypothetical protein
MGHCPAVRDDPDVIVARKRRLTVRVAFARQNSAVATSEGDVRIVAGDAIITGSTEERWPVSRTRFAAKYRPVPPLADGADGLYESIPRKVLALAMSEDFAVLLPDGISELHGHPGDWLVDYGDGSLGIVAGALFESFYEREPLGTPLPPARSRGMPPFHAIVRRLLLLGWHAPPQSRHAIEPPERLCALVGAVEDEHRLANSHAIEYGNHYRNTFWAIYLLSALAVLFAFMPYALEWDRPEAPMHERMWIWGVCELVVIGAVAFLYYQGHRRRWHLRWLASRTHAEFVWYAPLVAALIEHPAEGPRGNWYNRAFAQGRRLDESGEVDALCERLEPLARAATDGAWADAEFVGAFAAWSCSIFDGQRRYHEGVAAEQRALSHRIHVITTWLFVLIFLAAAAHLVVHAPILSLAAVFLPALGAALHGALAQSEAQRLALNSTQLRDALAQALERIHSCTAREPLAARAEGLREAVRSALSLILEEHQGWHLAMRTHRLKLG